MKRAKLSGIILVILAILALGLGCSQSAPAAAPAPTAASAKAETSPSLIITPISALAAAKLTIYGAGFAPGENVKISVESNDLTIVIAVKETGGIVKANEFGAFALKNTVGIPFTLTPGMYTLRAEGNKGSVATSPLEVIEPKK